MLVVKAAESGRGGKKRGQRVNVTIKDIAEKAHVSYATVSRALNGKYGVKPDTREKILAIAGRLNYRPNAIARGLVKNQTHTLGLVIPDITNPFFPEVARGIEDAAQEAGFSLFLCNTNWEEDKEARYLSLLQEKRVDGVIIAPIADQERVLEQALSPRLPLVYVSRAPRETRRSFVVIDNVRGGFLATEHLIRQGYQSIGFIGALGSSLSIDERLEGYKSAFAKYGLRVEERVVLFGNFKRETGYNLIRRLIAEGEPPRAVFAENDLLALGVMQGAREAGLSVPGDLAVIGFDDIPFASFPEVQLSTIAQPKYAMGKTAVELLIAAIEQEKQPGAAVQQIFLEPKLIVRRSSS
jgi:LacI family transcriptional regulator